MKKIFKNLEIIGGCILAFPFMILMILSWMFISLFLWNYYPNNKNYWPVTKIFTNIVDRWIKLVWDEEF